MKNEPLLKLAVFLKYTVLAGFLADVAAVAALPLWLPYLYREDIVSYLYRGAEAGPGSDYYGLMVFLAFCGSCTAVILFSVFLLMGRLCRHEPFSVKNGLYMRACAVAAFLISAAGLVRVVMAFSLYNVALTAVFILAGLFCLVFGELFLQAARMKEENDLTI